MPEAARPAGKLEECERVLPEHPGPPADRCVTCGDAAAPGRVLEIRGQTAFVEVEGVREEVAIELLEDDVAVGDTVLCHAGIALDRLA